MPKTQAKTTPPFLAQARAFYAQAFDHRRKSELADAMADWAELDDAEHSFALAHLAFLSLEAQASTQHLLAQVRDLLDELAEAFTLAVEASLAEPPDEDEDEDPGELPALDAAPAQALLPEVIEAEPPPGAP